MPLCAAGHSLGEYSALVCSHALSFEDALRIVVNRAVFMKESSQKVVGTMAAVTNLDRRILEEACRRAGDKEGEVVISNYNALNQITVSGKKEAVDNLIDSL